MVKYKKYISIILLLIIIFNVCYVQVKADIQDTLRHAFILFVAVLNSYNIVTNTQTALKLFDNYVRGHPNEINDLKTNVKNVLNLGIIDMATIGWGLNNWIKDNFKKGYNEKEVDIVKTEDIRKYFNGTYTIYYLDDGAITYKGQSYLRISKSGSNYNTVIAFIKDNINYYNLGLLNVKNYIGKRMDVVVDSDGEEKWKYELYIDGIILETKNNIGFHKNIKVDIDDKENVYLYAGEVVDYPMDEYPEEKPLVLPAPNFDDERFYYDDAGNRVFDGTVEQFLDSAFDKQADYLDIATDRLLSGVDLGVRAVVDVGAGTITWSKSGVIGDVGVDIPDITYPDNVTDAVNEQTGVIGSIAQWLSDVFAEPSLSFNMDPLMQFNIKDKFPFCLPFDLAYIITNLSSDSETPKFQLKFPGPKNESVEYEMNFEMFEPLAVILRSLIVLSYVIGLVLISRKLIGGE